MSRCHFAYIYIFPTNFILISRRGDQDEAVGAICVCMGAVLSVCDDLCGWLCVYAHCIHVCMCVPVGNTCLALCLGFGWDRVNFLLSGWYSAVFWI